MKLTVDTDSYVPDDRIRDLVYNSPDVRKLKEWINPKYGRDIVTLILDREADSTIEKMYKDHTLWKLFSKSRMVFKPINGCDCDRCLLDCYKKTRR